MVSRSRLRRIALGAALLSAAALFVFLSSQHRVRIVLGSYQSLSSVNQVNWDPALTSEARSYSAYFHPEIQNASSFTNAVRILTAFQVEHPPIMGDPMPGIDDPDSCLVTLTSGRPTHCYNIDIAVNRLLAERGVYCRMWDLNGPRELGGYGHNILEVWDRPSSTWRVLDPYYHAYFIADTDTATPLSFAQLRTLALTDPQRIRIVRYLKTPLERLDRDIIAEHSFLDSLSMLHANNNFRWRYDHRYGALMPIASFVDRFPLRYSRALRTFMLGRSDLHYVIDDNFSPHYPFVFYKILFYSLLLLFLVSLVLLLSVKRTNRRFRFH